MLVNLTPKNKFRTMSERHCKYMNRIKEPDEPKYCPLKFKDLFEPTEYTGVYMTSLSHYGIESWCKQRAFYDTKKFKDMIHNIPIGDLTTYMDTDLNAWTYGVADNLEQIVHFYKNDRDNYFRGNHVIFVREILKDSTAPCCGWRWHKWGEYIGTQNPKCEYLNDEPEIEKVLCFSIYKVV